MVEKYGRKGGAEINVRREEEGEGLRYEINHSSSNFNRLYTSL
jgi:hypothetical protein